MVLNFMIPRIFWPVQVVKKISKIGTIEKVDTHDALSEP